MSSAIAFAPTHSMDPDADAPPFWPQPPTRRRRHHPPSPLLNPLILILAIPILILILLFVLLPSSVSQTNPIVRPNSVKKSWDSINVLLVLFAVLCGVFARRNEDVPPSDDDRRVSSGAVSVDSNLVNRSRQFAPTWLDFPDRKEYNRISSTVNGGGGKLRRSSSSYPDLRQETLWESDGIRSRFVDDFDVNFYRSPPRENFDSHMRRRHAPEREEEPETTIREIPVDKFEISSTLQPLTPPMTSTPPPPPPSVAVPKKRRSVHSVSRKDHGGRRRNESEISENLRRAPPPPPPPPPEPSPAPKVQKQELIHRKKSGATKDFASAIASLYKTSQRKRKKRTKNRDIYESASQDSSPPSVTEQQLTPPPPPPPPPPLPPPSKVLQNLFKKSSKSKRVHSVPTTATHPPPPPPPPPPPSSIFNNIFKSGTKSKRFEKSFTAPPPPPPPSSILNSIIKNDSKSRRLKNNLLPPPPPDPPRPRQFTAGRPPKPKTPATRYYEEEEETMTVAPPSPLIPLPPPPPPFIMPEFKFVAQGDFVRIRSAHSSRCSSPEVEDVDVKSESISCPSPDVNAKADTFIARLRGEWRMEKMNSMK